MCKIFWTWVFCSSAILYSQAQAQAQEDKTEYKFVGRVVEQGKLSAVLMARDKKESKSGDKLILKDVTFYFPSPEKADAMGKVKLSGLKAFAKKHPLGVRRWTGDEIELDTKKGKGLNENLKAKDLSSFRWNGQARLEFGFHLERKVLEGKDIGFKDNVLSMPKEFTITSRAYNIEGASATIKMKEGELIDEKASNSISEQLFDRFESMKVQPPIKVTTFIMEKEKKSLEKKALEKKAQEKKKEEEPRPFVMKLTKELNAKMTSKNEMSFISKGSTHGYFDDHKMDLYVTGDSVHGSLVSGQDIGIQYMELTEPWVLIEQFSNTDKKNKTSELNMSGRRFRLFPESLEVTGQPVSIWNRELVGTVSRIFYRRVIPGLPQKLAGVVQFQDLDSKIDRFGWQKMQEKEIKKIKEKEKPKVGGVNK
jgi:hypothetical protein